MLQVEQPPFGVDVDLDRPARPLQARLVGQHYLLHGAGPAGGPTAVGRSARRAAEKFGVGHTSVSQAKALGLNAPDLAAEVKAGTKLLGPAYDEMKKRQAAYNNFLRLLRGVGPSPWNPSKVPASTPRSFGTACPATGSGSWPVIGTSGSPGPKFGIALPGEGWSRGYSVVMPSTVAQAWSERFDGLPDHPVQVHNIGEPQ